MNSIRPFSNFRCFTIFWIALIAAPHFSWGIVNIEALRMEDTHSGWKRELEVSASKLEGNTKKSKFEWGGMLFHRQPQHESFLVYKYRYDLGATGKADVNKQMLHLRHAQDTHKQLAWEIYGQYQKNQFTRLSFRGLLGGGVRVRVHKSKPLVFFLGLGLFDSWETLSKNEVASDDGTVEAWRLGSYLSFKWIIDENVHFTSITYYQPKIDQLNDFYLIEEMEIKLKINQFFSFAPYYSLSRNSRPPQLIEGTDHHYGSKLKLQF